MIRKRKRHAGQGVPLCKILLLFHQNGGKAAGLQQGAQVIRRRGKEKCLVFAKSRCYFIRTAERRQASSRERRSSGGGAERARRLPEIGWEKDTLSQCSACRPIRRESPP